MTRPDVESPHGGDLQSNGKLETGKPVEDVLQPGTKEFLLHLPVQDINPLDEGTKDSWVPRHVDMVRLTGRHPFNAECTPELLMESFTTPPSLHYVRNHGATPQMAWDSHRVQVNGLVDQPTVFTMADLLKLPTVDVTCTLTCAGNRRKEQNMVKKTIGFNWGPSGTSCSTWTGVRLGDLLQSCGIQGLEQGAAYVCMRGPKGELPKGDDGSYGTSITVQRAMDPGYDVILAYKQNGRFLTPDHGFPVRVIIPGYIGGRMIKWLEEITVTTDESQNYYHFHDNRVLPSHVDDEKANAEGWWYKPDFIINDLNINSAIISPGHDEALAFTAGACTFRGYAYSNGNKIIRCELSLDDGATWRLAEVTQRVPPNAAGRHWGWVWWEMSVPCAELLGCKEVVCRAWDSCMNTQPNTFTWNVMGMMNNCIYRVRIHPRPTSDGRFALQFEHPTLAGAQVGGWMNPADARAAPVEVTAAAPPGGARLISMEEVEKHDTKDSAWFVYEGRVYDATPFLDAHPGGADSILLVAGTDATDEFNAIHSPKAKAMLLDYYIGDLDVAPSGAAPAANGHANGVAVPAAVPAAAADPVALNPKKRLHFALAEKHELSHNVRRFRFALPTPQHRLGLPVGKHVFLYATVEGELVMRAYTPASLDQDLGYFDLVIKVYRANEHPKFPLGGKMSQYLDTLAIGDTIEVKGPVGHVHYLGHGRYMHNGAEHQTTRINMIAGGTGITPCFQIIQSVLRDAEDTTQLALLYANQSPDDILLKEELDAFAASHSNFKVWYTVDRAGEDWPFSTGFVNRALIEEHLYPASANTICGLCGPPGLIAFACKPNLEAVGFEEAQMLTF